MADEPKPASQSLAERIKALTAKAAAPAAAAPAAAPAAPPPAKAGDAPKPADPAKPAEAAKAPPAAGSLSARIAALTAKAQAGAPTAPPAAAAPAAPTTPASPATAAAPSATPGAATSTKPAAGSLSARIAALSGKAPAAPAAAPPAASDDSAPAVGVVGASPLAEAKRLSLSERLKTLASGKTAEPGAARATPASSAAAAAKPAAPPPKAAPPLAGRASPAGTSAPALPAKPLAKAAAKPAPAPEPAAPDIPPWPDFPANKYTPYVDDTVFEMVPKEIQRIILEATNEEGVIPVQRFLRKLQEPERSAQEELLVGFMENLISTLKTRFFLDDEEPERKMFVEPSGDLSMRTGDGEVKVRAKCWEFFFLFRQKKWIGASKKDRRKALLSIFEECFNFQIGDTTVCKMKTYEPVDFAAAQEAHYLEGQLELGGWCELRFEAATVFTDGRVLVATFQPRVIRAKDVPAPKAMSPKEFVGLLAKKRRR